LVVSGGGWLLAFWFLWPWLEMMAPGATERGVTITWIAGQVEHAAQMIGALTLSFHNYIYLHEFFFYLHWTISCFVIFFACLVQNFLCLLTILSQHFPFLFLLGVKYFFNCPESYLMDTLLF